jgi:hypothetical protein
VRTYRCALGRLLFADAVSVGLIPTDGALQHFGLNGLSSPLMWGRGRGLLGAFSFRRSSKT